jgi:carbonic anhydrase
MPLKFFNTDEIKDKKLKEKAEKLLKRAEKEVLAMSHLKFGVHHARIERRVEGEKRAIAYAAPLQIDFIDKKIIDVIAAQKILEVRDSIKILVEGNRNFLSQLKRTKIARLSSYDTIILACSDSRCDPTEFGDFSGKRVLMLQTAGNVVFDDAEKALKKISYLGEVVVCGHVNCGACNAKAEESKFRGKSKSVDKLLDHVDISGAKSRGIYAANAVNQAKLIEKNDHVRKENATVTPIEINFTSSKTPLRMLGGEKTEFFSGLEESAKRKVEAALRQGKTFEKHYAHAIVVSDPFDLGTFSNVRTRFSAGLNEIFAISATGGKVSKEAIASMEYALQNVNCVKETSHIVIMHSDPKIAEEMKAAILSASELIKEKTSGGKSITIMRHIRSTGEVSVA